MTAAPVRAPVVVCLCGHAPRLHPDDDGHACRIPGCGCVEFREFRPGRVTPSDAAALRALDKPRPVPTPPLRDPVTYPCPEPGCGAAFTTKQGLAGHGGNAHGRRGPRNPETSPTAAEQPAEHDAAPDRGTHAHDAAEPHATAPQPVPAGPPHPPAGAAPTGYGCEQCGKRFDTKQGLGGHNSRAHRNPPSAPPVAPEQQPARTGAYAFTARLDLGPAGTVTLTGENLTETEFGDILVLLAERFGTNR